MPTPSWRATVIDYGVKRNILRMLAGLGADITVVPAQATLEDVMRHKPDGVLLSNGPGDPAATGAYSIPTIKGLVDSNMPVFGICLGHQMLGLALGAQTQQDGARPSRREPSGEGSGDRQGRDRVDEPRLHGRSRHAAQGRARKRMSRCSTAPIAASPSRAARCSACSIIPKPRPGPMDSHYLFDRFARAAKGEK